MKIKREETAAGWLVTSSECTPSAEPPFRMLDLHTDKRLQDSSRHCADNQWKWERGTGTITHCGHRNPFQLLKSWCVTSSEGLHGPSEKLGSRRCCSIECRPSSVRL
ncbi:uncharacterized protein isoform X4 [Macaca fascicularis]|uniref:uncharacterized protein isoform X4 n=1 Tax=Macaca fascicularis TaxID=9541 RepID=UPI003D154625